ncbi:enoyl ACP reductase FabMG family protein [Shimia sp.]|uniref:enoyl ACP reductase FabMG family protein n=1 Tax=Shimia sp. TaxID=1954381 RepID=UPI003BA9B53D
MKHSIPLTALPENTVFGAGDVFVLFGELFGRGYATGLIEAAKAAGMDVIGITVGRREDDGALRALTDEEHAAAEENLGGKIINIPLMAGFDMDAPAGGETPTDMLGDMTLDNWQEYKLDWAKVDACREIGTARFTEALGRVMAELEGLIPEGKNVFFAHTMAGGIPRAKAFLAIANRIYKGRGARHMPSQALMDSDLGKLILQNFDEVTANSFGHLLEQSAALRSKIEAGGGQVRYSAYGYHGTRVLIDGAYQWQTYTSYTQGYAKMNLEAFAQKAWEQGVKATVFNCPEIRTNSSDVFAGIELSLVPLLEAYRKEGGGDWVQGVWDECQALLKEGETLEAILETVGAYQQNPVMQSFYNFEAWPMQNSPEQVEMTVGTSADIVALHKNRKELVSDVLSAHVVSATGALIFGASSNADGPVLWLDHDLVAQQLIAANS